MPYLFTCQRALRAYVLKCQRALRVYVLPCQRALRAYVLTCRRALRASVRTCLECLRAHVPTCLACSCAKVPYVLTCNVPCVSTCSCAIKSTKISFQWHVLVLLLYFLDFCEIYMKSPLYEEYTTSRYVSRNIYFENLLVHSCISLIKQKLLTCYDKLSAIWHGFCLGRTESYF